MQVQTIQYKQNFAGTVFAKGLSKKQQKIFEYLKPTVQEYVKNKNYSIYIDGTNTLEPNCLLSNGKTPKYVHFQTLPDHSEILINPASVSSSLKPKIWMRHIRKIMFEHEQSPYYTPEIYVPSRQKIKNFIKNILKLNTEKQ